MVRKSKSGRPEIFLPRCRQAGQDRRLSAHGKARHGGSQTFFAYTMAANDSSDKVAMDNSGADKAAIDMIHFDRDVPILVRWVKYLNNIVP